MAAFFMLLAIFEEPAAVPIPPYAVLLMEIVCLLFFSADLWLRIKVCKECEGAGPSLRFSLSPDNTLAHNRLPAALSGGLGTTATSCDLLC